MLECVCVLSGRGFRAAKGPARPAHLLLGVHEAAWGHGRQEAWRLGVLRRRRHLELERGCYARHRELGLVENGETNSAGG